MLFDLLKDFICKCLFTQRFYGLLERCEGYKIVGKIVFFKILVVYVLSP